MVRVTLALVLTSAMVVSLAGAADAGNEFEPKCRASTSAVASHRLEFRVKCNFEATDITIRPTADVLKVNRRTTVLRPDPEDRFSCRRKAERRIGCGGRAGRGATVVGRFRVEGPACAVQTRFEIFGGIDCDGPGFCPLIGYSASRRDREPTGCS